MAGFILIAAGQALPLLNMAWQSYLRALAASPIITKALTAAGLASSGDFIAQKIEQWKLARQEKKLDVERSVSTVIRGAVLNGALAHLIMVGFFGMIIPGRDIQIP